MIGPKIGWKVPRVRRKWDALYSGSNRWRKLLMDDSLHRLLRDQRLWVTWPRLLAKRSLT
jgi:hypothetical protein